MYSLAGIKHCLQERAGRQHGWCNSPLKNSLKTKADQPRNQMKSATKAIYINHEQVQQTMYFGPHFFLGFTPGKVPGLSTAPMAIPNSARDFFTVWPVPVAPVALSG